MRASLSVPCALATLSLLLAGCGSADRGARLLYEEPAGLGALHSPARVGRPMAEALQQAPRPPSHHALEADGREVAIWTQANVDLQEAATVYCQEILTARDGTVTDYHRQGDHC